MIGSIENGILARLKAAAAEGVLGYAWHTLESLPVDDDIEEITKKVLRWPAAWVVFSGWRKVRDFGDGSCEVEARFHVVVGTEHVRNVVAARQGAGDQVGSYQLSMDVAGLLMGQDFGLEIGGLVLGDANPILVRPALSVFAVAFTTRFTVDPRAPSLGQPVIGDFAAFHVNWDLPPFVGVGPELPDDAKARLTSHQTLPTQES